MVPREISSQDRRLFPHSLCDAYADTCMDLGSSTLLFGPDWRLALATPLHYAWTVGRTRANVCRLRDLASPRPAMGSAKLATRCRSGRRAFDGFVEVGTKLTPTSSRSTLFGLVHLKYVFGHEERGSDC